MSSALSSLHAVSVHFYPPSVQKRFMGCSHLSSALTPHRNTGKMERNGRLSLTVSAWFCVSGYSLVEEGEQVTHYHQCCPRDAQQDLTDALRPLIQVFYPCSKIHIHQNSRRQSLRLHEVSVTQRHVLKNTSRCHKEKQPAPYLCRGEDEFQKDKETLKRNKRQRNGEGKRGCVGRR